MSRAEDICSKNPALAKQIAKAKGGEPAAKAAKPRKYRNKPCERNGERFDSILEADVYDALVARYGARNVMRQVRLSLGGGRFITPDFMVIIQHESMTEFDHKKYEAIHVFFADAKGLETPDWRTKRDWLRDKHGIEIRLIRKASEV